MGFQRTVLGDALDLGNDDAAIVAGRKRLVEAAEIGAFVFIGQVAVFIRRCRPDDGDLGMIAGK